ncbi:taste receptor type 2 member 7-like [Heteronotia binoei]|uniref:taste receptor type 2 member 7-like n=1 Tax=Heteronotia binoei TaxID=13085 RepID=UPI002930374D|nr:taste receptor type 2 member 7-like [Heteronotia binoei]
MPLFDFGFLLINTLIRKVSNGSIVLIIYMDWFRSRKLSPTDLILSSLGLSRVLLEMVIILNATTMFSFFKQTYILNEMQLIINIMWIFTNNVSLWFAASLSVLYFVKITIFSHPFFLQMKQIFSGLVPWLLLGSMVFSAVVTIIVITAWGPDFSICNPYKSLFSSSSNPEILNFTIVSTAPNFIPIVIFLLSSVFLISSLWKHIRQVQHNGTGIKDLSTQVHLTAIKALVSFAILYLSSFVAVTLRSTLARRKYEQNWISILLGIVGVLYPSGHAIILIIISPKLKLTWMQTLRHLKCHPSEASS